MRPSRDEWGLQLAEVTAQRATCLRRSVGCVLIDRHGHVLATGYNGVAAGQPHCNEVSGRVFFADEPMSEQSYAPTYPNACPGARSASGTNLDGCQAIHAEQNALLQCRDVQAIETCYVTCSPCLSCVKMLLNTSCQRIVYRERYAHGEALDLWIEAQRYHQPQPRI